MSAETRTEPARASQLTLITRIIKPLDKNQIAVTRTVREHGSLPVSTHSSIQTHWNVCSAVLEIFVAYEVSTLYDVSEMSAVFEVIW